MQVLFNFGILISTVLAVVAGQPAMLQAEALFPSCALNCLAATIPQSTCNITDIACICTDVPLNDRISLCVASSCTIKESLTTKNVSMTMCGAKPRDKTNQVSYIGIVGGILALMAFFLRMWSRLLGAKGEQTFGFDDATMCLLIGLALPPTIFSLLLAKNGLGKDIWTLPFDNITRLLYYYFLGESFYLAAIAINKMAILLLIFRVFGDVEFRKYIYVVMALCTGYGISFVFATVFQCAPINYSWNNWDGEHGGTCNNIHLQGWLSAAFNIALDVMVIALPMPKMFKLNMGWKKKIMVIWMFSLGALVTIISIVRLRSLVEFAHSQNVTWDYVPAAYWSTIELHLGIICACLPAVRLLLIRAFPKIASSETGQSTNNSDMAARYTTSVVQAPIPHPVSKGPYSTPPDHFNSMDRLNFIPLVDVEKQDKTRTQNQTTLSLARETKCNWPLG